MTYVVMAYTVTAYAVIAYVVMAYAVMACVVMPYDLMAQTERSMHSSLARPCMWVCAELCVHARAWTRTQMLGQTGVRVCV